MTDLWLVDETWPAYPVLLESMDDLQSHAIAGALLRVYVDKRVALEAAATFIRKRIKNLHNEGRRQNEWVWSDYDGEGGYSDQEYDRIREYLDWDLDRIENELSYDIVVSTEEMIADMNVRRREEGR